jgi:ABC-type nitrate/sulfonate/bicarbonate transport system ATPase subunit
MDPGPALLTAAGVTVARGRRRLLGHVDLEVRRGEVVVVLGPNGVGKSSLLAVLGGLLAPAAGTVRAAGRVAATLQAPALARRSVRANLDLALGWWGVPRAERPERMREALALLRIEHLAGRTAPTLSGGEARRVHLARALALRSDVLLLDEPFAGLDPPTRAALLGDATAALRSPDRGTLVVVHDRAEAWALADRVVVLLDGGVAAQGPPLDVLDHPGTHSLADFLGFSGRVRGDDGAVVRVRPGQAVLDDDAPLRGRVAGRLAEQDGVLCDVALDGGRGSVQVRVARPGPEPGEEVGVRVLSGARVPEAEARPSTI